MLLSKPKSTGNIASASTQHTSSLLDSDNDCDTHSLASIRQDEFFRSYQTPSALADYLDPPSPKSFYSVATSSSGGTARAIPPGRSSFDSIPPLPSGDLHSSSPPRSHPGGLLPSLDFSGDLHSEMGAEFGMRGMSGMGGKVGGGGMNAMDAVGVDAVEQWVGLTMGKALMPKELCIAVVGMPGSGKSTFIQKAFNLSHLASKNTLYSRTVPFDKYLYEVRLIEIDVLEMDIDRQPIAWPRVCCGYSSWQENI